MPKIEKPPYSVRRVLTNANSKYAKEKWQLLGRTKIFGRRIREYRATKKAAEELGEKYVGELRAHGQQATPLSDIERAGAVQAIRLLGDSGDLVTAVKFFLDHAPRKGDITVAKAAELFAATRGISPETYHRPKGMWRKRLPSGKQPDGKYSDHHRTTLRTRLKRFEKSFGRERVRTVALQPQTIRQYLSKFPNQRTHQNHRSTLFSLFQWCLDKGYCAKNPAAPWTEQKQELRDYEKAHRPGILTPAEFKALLSSAQQHDPQMVAYLIFGGFMALRPEELEKARWEDVKDVFVFIRPELSKTGDSAELQILPPLQRWLAVYRKSSGQIAPPNASARRLVLWRRIHGLDPVSATVEELRKCPAWPADALRHSYGTYRFKVVGGIDTVCAEMRHEDPRVFKKYYVKRGITAAEANAYFAVVPSARLDARAAA